MSTTIKGAFKSLEDKTIYVEIKSPSGLAQYNIGENEIKFTDDPIEIESNCDKLFSHIIKKQCTISLVTSIWLGSLFTGNDRDITVTVWKDNDIIFSGYAEPQSFSQGWANTKETFELNCVDYLSTLKNHKLTDYRSYKQVKSQNNILSFKDYLALILPSFTYFDNTKNLDGSNIFDSCGVSMNAFLGDDEDDLMNNEEILNSILTYLNLHAIQIGQKILLFDWNTIGSQSTWRNIYDNTSISIDTSYITVTQEMYASNDTNISMNEIYNRISVTDKFEKRETVVNSPLDSKEIKYYSDYKQMWYSEIVSKGEGEGATNAFRAVVNQMYANFENIVYTDYDGWYREDWYMKWAYNPNWKLYWHGQPIENWLEYDSNGKIINQHRIMQALKQNRFMPAMVSVGANKNKISNKRPSRLNNGNVVGEIPMTDYLVISVNGTLNDSTEEFSNLDRDLRYAANVGNGDISYTEASPLFVYSGESGNFTPPNDGTTNYLIFSGSMILNPVYLESGIFMPFGFSEQTLVVNKPDITFKETYDNQSNGLPLTVNISDNSDGAFYSQQFYSCADPSSSLETLEPTKLMLYPYVKEDKRQELEYNYSAHWNSEDKIDKLEILVCQMQIGDKYLVETTNGNRQKPSYSWMTLSECQTHGYQPTFTLGIDPEIGDKIVGKEYEICNTVNGRYSNEKGLAIPITYDDALSGAVTFKILTVCNSVFNEITRRHPTWFRSEKYFNNYKNLLSHISSIWLKEFDIKIISDNGGADVSADNTDLVWYSNQNHSSIIEADSIDFDITTQPDTQVLIEHGIPTNVSNTNVVNMNTNTGIEHITDTVTNQTSMPEWLYIDHYYRWYSSPRAIVETTILQGDIDWPELHGYTFNDFGNTTTMSIVQNLKKDTVTIKAIQNT